MKNITLLLSLFAFLILSPKSMAQEEVPKELLLSTLNSVAHLNLEKEPLDQLLELPVQVTKATNAHVDQYCLYTF